MDKFTSISVMRDLIEYDDDGKLDLHTWLACMSNAQSERITTVLIAHSDELENYDGMPSTYETLHQIVTAIHEWIHA
jgi:hypothetical protein